MEPPPDDSHAEARSPTLDQMLSQDAPNNGTSGNRASLPNYDGMHVDPDDEKKPPPRVSPTDDVENRPPVDVISASSHDPNNHLVGDSDPLEDMSTLEDHHHHHHPSNDQRLAPPSRFVPGPLREEPTLKEKLVDRERQRRKEAERARLKRQFALMSNGGGLVYDSAGGGGGASITGTVGEESTHADMEDSASGLMHSHNHHHSQGGDNSPQPLGYTMERFLQETATNSTDPNNHHVPRGGAVAVATAIASSVNSFNAIREETIEGEAPDKGVVMERFLNDPVVVDTAPPPTPAGLSEDPQIPSRSDDVHRSVSFDIDFRTTLPVDTNSNTEDSHRRPDNTHPTSDTTDDHLHLSVDDSNASVRVEVAPEDNIMAPVSPGGRLSVPSEVAPSSLETDEHGRHHRQHSEMETSLGSALGSVGPSMGGGQSISSNPMNNATDDDDDSNDEPRVLRLTEAEIQEMAAIEHASIGNAPPSDRDAESLVGDLVGTFGTPNVEEAGTNFSQETPTTAMESGSLLSGNPMSTQRSSAMPDDQPQRSNHGNDHDMDQNSIDEIAMSASVSSHLVVSPGASVSGSAESVTANPPSEIIGRGDTTIGDDRHEAVPPPPSSVVVESTPEMPPLASPPLSVVAAEADDDRHSETNLALQPSAGIDHTGTARLPPSSCALGESLSSIAIREELKTLSGPQAEDIVNRQLRPGMVETSTPMSPQRSNSILASNIVDTPNNNRTVDEFDFDKNDLPMTPRSLMSDSLQDLPGDDGSWASPGAKFSMTVSPIQRSGDTTSQYQRRDPNLDPRLAVPRMPRVPANATGTPANSGANNTEKLDMVSAWLERVFDDVRNNNSSAEEAKQSELYSRGSILSNALEKRLLPLLATLFIEVPLLRLLSHNESLCSLLGRQHYQLLLGFIPIIAAISGNASAQANSLTTTAIWHKQLTSRCYRDWIQKECKIAGLIGLSVGGAVAALAFYVASGTTKDKMVFAATVGIAQFISATVAGCAGANSPVLMSFVFKQHARNVGGLTQRALVDLISATLTTMISYCTLLIFVSPANPVDACLI